MDAVVRLGLSEGQHIRFNYREGESQAVTLENVLVDNRRVGAVATSIDGMHTFTVIQNTSNRQSSDGSRPLAVYRDASIQRSIRDGSLPEPPDGNPYRWVTNIEPVDGRSSATLQHE